MKCRWEIPGVPRKAANSYYPLKKIRDKDFHVTYKTDYITDWKIEGGENLKNKHYYSNLWDTNPLTGWIGLASRTVWGLTEPDSQAKITANFKEQVIFIEFGLKTHSSSISCGRKQSDYEKMCLVVDDNEYEKDCKGQKKVKPEYHFGDEIVWSGRSQRVRRSDKIFKFYNY